MLEDYTVAVKVKLFNEVTGGLLIMSKQFDALTGKALKLQTAVKGIQATMYSGFKMVAAGGALAAPFVYAITKAAELQKQMIGIQIATRGSAQQMDSLRGAIEQASSRTIFSALDVAKMAKVMATSNAFNAPQLQALMPIVAQFADVQALMKGTPYSQSVVDAVKLMHLAQKYSPQDVVPYFDQLTKASFVMPGGIGELMHALAYFQPMGKSALGVSDQSSILLAAMLNRLGLSGSRGGTNLLAAMTRTIPGVFGSGLLKGKSHEALADMGFIDAQGHSKFMTNGAFDPTKWIQGLSQFVNQTIAKDPLHGRERIMIDFQHAFGVQGSKVASLLSSPQAIDQLSQIGNTFQQLASTGAIQDQFVKQSVSQQFQTAMTNFQNAMIELGTTLLPLATKFLNEVNAQLNILIPWMKEHKQLVGEIAKGFVFLAAAMAIGGTLTILVSGFTALNLIVAGLAPELAAVGIAFMGLYKLMNLIVSEIKAHNPHYNGALPFGGYMFGSGNNSSPVAPRSQSSAVTLHVHNSWDANQASHAVLKATVGQSQLAQNSMPGSFVPGLTSIANGWSGNFTS